MDKISIIVAQFVDRGWAICEEFLPQEDIEGLAEEAKSLHIKGDHLIQMDQSKLTPLQKKYWTEIEILRLNLNRELFIGLREFEAHFAVYPPGTFYKKHLDRFSSSDELAIFCTLYLDLEYPRAGTFVAFISDIFYHEVLPASKEGLSINGWLRI